MLNFIWEAQKKSFWMQNNAISYAADEAWV